MIYARGNSGCQVSVVDGEIHKTTNASPDRLLRQMKKQRDFRHDTIRTPRILEELPDGFSMEYISGRNILDLINKEDYSVCDGIIERLLGFIVENIESSRKHDCIDIIRLKFSGVIENIGWSDDRWKVFLDRFSNVVVPLSYCHGDFTLSNVIIKDESVYLIDFLDSYIDTPLQDMVKLRQDTVYHWTARFLNDPDVDITKTKIYLKYIDNIINKKFLEYDFYREYYELFQFMNLLRILPYTKQSQKITDEIIKWINQLICPQ